MFASKDPSSCPYWDDMDFATRPSLFFDQEVFRRAVGAAQRKQGAAENATEGIDQTASLMIAPIMSAGKASALPQTMVPPRYKGSCSLKGCETSGPHRDKRQDSLQIQGGTRVVLCFGLRLQGGDAVKHEIATRILVIAALLGSAGRGAWQALGERLGFLPACARVTDSRISQGPMLIDYTEQDAEFLEWLASAEQP